MNGAQKYIADLTCVETPQMLNAKKRMQEDGWPIHISPIAGKIIETQLRLINAQKIVEIGPYAAYSTMWLLKGVGDKGHIWSIERDQKRINLTKATIAELSQEQQEQITLLSGDAKEVLPTLKDGPFDAVFIDADKRFYNEFLDWAEQNIRQGGLIIADNVLLEGSVYMDELPGRVRESTRDSMRLFNQRLAEPARYNGFMLDHDDGLFIAQKLF